MRQNNFSIQLFHLHDSRLVRVHSQIDQVSDRLGHPRRVQTTLGQDSANDRVFITLGDIAASDDNIFEKQARIRAMLARVGEFSFGQGSMHPSRLHDRDQYFVGEVVGFEVDGVRYDVSTVTDVIICKA